MGRDMGGTNPTSPRKTLTSAVRPSKATTTSWWSEGRRKPPHVQPAESFFCLNPLIFSYEARGSRHADIGTTWGWLTSRDISGQVRPGRAGRSGRAAKVGELNRAKG